MRPKERINIFFKYCNTEKKMYQFVKWLDIFEGEDRELFYKDLSQQIIYNKKELKKIWKDGYNQDLRFTQLLIVYGLLDNAPGYWFYKEEGQFLLDVLKVAPEKVLIWGKNYDKNMKRLKKTKYRPIEKMTTEHIQAILDHVEKGEMKIGEVYKGVFEKVINSRNNE